MDLVESHQEELRFARGRVVRALLIAGVAIAIAVPFSGQPAWIVRGTLIAITAIGVLGQNLLIGHTGQISFGQAGFLAIGAYTFAHVQMLPWPLALLVAGLAAAVAGVLVGFPSLRLKGPYLAIATLGFGIAVYQLLANASWLSGGRTGVAVQRPPMEWLYWQDVLLLAIFALATVNLISSYAGRAFMAVRDSEIAAEAVGVNLTRTKLLAFAVSSFYTGVHGALFAQFLGHLEPELFNLGEVLTLFVAITVGGLASIEGSIFGAAFVVLAPAVFGAARWAVPVLFGGSIIVVLVFEPGGLAGGLRKARVALEQWPFR
ncbi:MAG: branched-chain amino acid ABC transporter permease [Myxococcales bacterium]|nr:branched-chain amino acid ABC transporter permease [Myxococcales bacterium]